MDTETKIELLGNSARFDICAADACMGTKGMGRKRAPYGLPHWIYPAVRPDGKRVLLMKVLMSNTCRNNCAYCANRCGGKHRPAAFTPDELAQTFLNYNRYGLAEGLFLSSAVENEHTMSRMLDTVEMIRVRAGFRGYIHLKILPGADFGHIERAVELATRVSINLEAPSAQHLQALAPDKNFSDDLFTRMKWIKQCLDNKQVKCRGQTTQFIVGAVGESDREIVDRTANLYQEVNLERAYFSAFQPVAGTPLENIGPAPLMREHRLYQVDFLLRKYRWKKEDLIYQPDDNLSLKQDPKYVWACHHPEAYPIEVNHAELQELLRVPGIGPISAKRILSLRKQGRLERLEDLRHFGVVVKRAAPFILLGGRSPAMALGQASLALW